MVELDLLTRSARPGDAAAVACILNAAIEAGSYTVLDTVFSVEAERQFIAGFPARGVFPDGRVLNCWATGEYQAQPDAWSPDGKRLAMSGNVPGEWRYALFVVEP